MAIKPVKRLSLQDQIYESLLEEIKSGNFAPGSKLPSMRYFMKEFKTSSSPIHNVLVKLTNKGLLELRHGSGTYVVDPRKAMELSESVCFCMAYESDIINDLYNRLRACFQQMGVLLTGIDIDADEQALEIQFERFLKSDVSCFIIHGYTYFPYDLLKKRYLKGKRFISLLGTPELDPLKALNPAHILLDYKTAGQQLSDYLINNGENQLLIVGTTSMIAAVQDPNYEPHGLSRLQAGINNNISVDHVVITGGYPDISLDNEDGFIDLLSSKNGPKTICGLLDADIVFIQKIMFKHNPELLQKIKLIGFGNTLNSKQSCLPFSSFDYNFDDFVDIIINYYQQSHDLSMSEKGIQYVKPTLVVR